MPEEIATERLHIRLWQPDDVPVLRRAIEESIEHLRPWLAWVPFEPLSDPDRRAMIEHSLDGWRRGGGASYGVFHRGEVVGACGLHHRWGPNTVDLGYWIHVDHVGRGFAREMAEGLTSAAFRVGAVDRVEIHHDKANERSRAIPAALGFERGPERPDDIGAPADTGIDCTWTMSRERWQSRATGTHSG